MKISTKIKEAIFMITLSLFGWVCISLDMGTWSIKTLIVCLFLVFTADLIGEKLMGHSLHKPLDDKDWE